MKNIESPKLNTLTCPIQKQTKAQGNIQVFFWCWHVFYCPFPVIYWLSWQPHDHNKRIIPPEVPEREYSSADRHRQRRKKERATELARDQTGEKTHYRRQHCSHQHISPKHGAVWKHKKDIFTRPFSTACFRLVPLCESNLL